MLGLGREGGGFAWEDGEFWGQPGLQHQVLSLDVRAMLTPDQ